MVDADQERPNLWEAGFEILQTFILITDFRDDEKPGLQNRDGIEILLHECRGASAESQGLDEFLYRVERARLQSVWSGAGSDKGFRHGIH
jgi:hypothetical protein